MNDFDDLFKFEEQVSDFFGASYGVAVDCCTHGLELCLRLSDQQTIICPKKTYVSVPFMLEKLNLNYIWDDNFWSEYYHLTPTIIDAATFWRKNGFVKNTKMCLSFHFKKHLNIGRGGMILLDNLSDYKKLVKMRYDGRSIHNGVLYDDDQIEEIGYHYYMTPETAREGLSVFSHKRDALPTIITSNDYSDVTELPYFKKKATST